MTMREFYNRFIVCKEVRDKLNLKGLSFTSFYRFVLCKVERDKLDYIRKTELKLNLQGYRIAFFHRLPIPGSISLECKIMYIASTDEDWYTEQGNCKVEANSYDDTEAKYNLLKKYYSQD